MAKKRSRKKAEKARKQRAGDIIISEALLNISEPLWNRCKEPDYIQSVISVTVMAWNISLFPKKERPHMQGILLESFPEKLSGKDAAELLECIDNLVECKNMLYPDVREYILTKDLSFSGDSFTLFVETAPVPEEIKRRSR